MSQILLITPPFTQLNTPYPATAYIKGFLKTIDISSDQMDLGIDVILSIYSKNGLESVFNQAETNNRISSENSKRIYQLRETYINTIDDVIQFLQSKKPTLARLICSGSFLPQASRFSLLDDMEWAFGNMGIQDQAKHLATLYLEDLSDFIVECVDEYFGFSRYAERLGRSANSFDELYETLQGNPTYVDELSFEILSAQLTNKNYTLVCFSVPFPGNLYSALRSAQFIKKHFPTSKVAMGGGFPNTELRSVTDPRVFEFIDYITLDDGERPLEILISNLRNPSPENPNHQLYKRTFLLQNEQVVYNNFSFLKDYQQHQVGTPDYSDLKLSEYISVIEIANPMHSIWSDGRWNKLTMAHGCYWGKCTFCDISLDYIKNYQPVAAAQLVDRMEELIAQTGESGFHFVDEAAPPALMRDVAIEILRRKLVVTWWTNIRFEKAFSRDLCRLLQASGCIAISGGLEVASDRLLELIQKGVTVEQVARVTRNLTEAGIMVHAYLMYGYPTQTVQETVDSLEMVRQLFEQGVVQSGFWHQFALTAHSPIGINPEAFGVLPKIKEIQFANNDIEFQDKTGINHDQFSFGLKKSLFNFMHGICFDYPLQDWFDFKIPKTTIAPSYIENVLSEDEDYITKPTSKIYWLGPKPIKNIISKTKKGRTTEFVELIVHSNTEEKRIVLEKKIGDWLALMIDKLMLGNEKFMTFNDLKKACADIDESFEMLWYSKEIDEIRYKHLLAI